jgi:hypothetical protein
LSSVQTVLVVHFRVQFALHLQSIFRHQYETSEEDRTKDFMSVESNRTTGFEYEKAGPRSERIERLRRNPVYLFEETAKT